jgi:6-phosphogluconolactonase
VADPRGRDPRLVIADDAPAVARVAAERLVAHMQAALDARGVAHVALTGGSTAGGLYTELASRWSDGVDWSRIHLWWGDERFVPVDHPESNAGLAYAMLLSTAEHAGMSGVGGLGTDVRADVIAGITLPAENVHPYPVEVAAGRSDDASLVAERYALEIRRHLPDGANGLPAFDVILLGVGGDGHILSCFPDSAALDASAPLVVAVPAPEHIGPHLPRLTLNPRVLDAAGAILVLVTGDAKAEVVHHALVEDGPAREVPARLARRASATWIVDRAAAARLDQAITSE